MFMSATALAQDWPQWLGPNRDSVWNEEGIAEVLNADGKRLASILHTANESRNVMGYVGSTYLLIVVDDAGKLENLMILESEDTVEHVRHTYPVLDVDKQLLELWVLLS